MGIYTYMCVLSCKLGRDDGMVDGGDDVVTCLDDCGISPLCLASAQRVDWRSGLPTQLEQGPLCPPVNQPPNLVVVQHKTHIQIRDRCMEPVSPVLHRLAVVWEVRRRRRNASVLPPPPVLVAHDGHPGTGHGSIDI